MSFNKTISCRESGQAGSEGMLFEFSMSALTALLRRQSEQNPSASYFNVDILKYQVCSFCASAVVLHVGHMLLISQAVIRIQVRLTHLCEKE